MGHTPEGKYSSEGKTGPWLDHTMLDVSFPVVCLASLWVPVLTAWLTVLWKLWRLRIQIRSLSAWKLRTHFRTKWSYQLYGPNTIKHSWFLLWNSEFEITAVAVTWVKLQSSSLLILSLLSNFSAWQIQIRMLSSLWIRLVFFFLKIQEFMLFGLITWKK